MKQNDYKIAIKELQYLKKLSICNAERTKYDGDFSIKVAFNSGNSFPKLATNPDWFYLALKEHWETILATMKKIAQKDVIKIGNEAASEATTFLCRMDYKGEQ